MSAPLLLDTCAVIWLVNAGPLPAEVIDLIRQAGKTEGVYVSTASAWEIGLLSRPQSNQRRGPNRRPVPDFLPDARSWFDRLMALPGVKEAPITPAIAIDSSHLPGDLHSDPADRLIIATARHLNMPIVTSDRKILDYAKAGHVNVIPC